MRAPAGWRRRHGSRCARDRTSRCSSSIIASVSGSSPDAHGTRPDADRRRARARRASAGTTSSTIAVNLIDLTPEVRFRHAQRVHHAIPFHGGAAVVLQEIEVVEERGEAAIRDQRRQSIGQRVEPVVRVVHARDARESDLAATPRGRLQAEAFGIEGASIRLATGRARSPRRGGQLSTDPARPAAQTSLVHPARAQPRRAWRPRFRAPRVRCRRSAVDDELRTLLRAGGGRAHRRCRSARPDCGWRNPRDSVRHRARPAARRSPRPPARAALVAEQREERVDRGACTWRRRPAATLRQRVDRRAGHGGLGIRRRRPLERADGLGGPVRAPARAPRRFGATACRRAPPRCSSGNPSASAMRPSAPSAAAATSSFASAASCFQGGDRGAARTAANRVDRRDPHMRRRIALRAMNERDRRRLSPDMLGEAARREVAHPGIVVVRAPAKRGARPRGRRRARARAPPTARIGGVVVASAPQQRRQHTRVVQKRQMLERGAAHGLGVVRDAIEQPIERFADSRSSRQCAPPIRAPAGWHRRAGGPTRAGSSGWPIELSAPIALCRTLAVSVTEQRQQRLERARGRRCARARRRRDEQIAVAVESADQRGRRATAADASERDDGGVPRVAILGIELTR